MRADPMRAPDTDLPIVFDDVSLLVGQDVLILDSVSLSIAAGAPTVLVGPNGSGKTTLLRTAMGLIAPTLGHVNWGGRDTTDGRRLSLMAQRPVMLRRSTAGNVAYALSAAGVDRRSRRARIPALLGQVGLSDLGRRPARRLSGGEQQRLALARALARNPEVLFLDEPSASLDPVATKAVEDIIRAVAACGVKIVMATHDLGQARRLAGDIVFLVGGRLAEYTPAERFFTAPSTPEGAAFLRGDLVI
jgi:tungstate transport system ATP-binding protein